MTWLGLVRWLPLVRSFDLLRWGARNTSPQPYRGGHSLGLAPAQPLPLLLHRSSTVQLLLPFALPNSTPLAPPPLPPPLSSQLPLLLRTMILPVVRGMQPSPHHGGVSVRPPLVAQRPNLPSVKERNLQVRVACHQDLCRLGTLCRPLYKAVCGPCGVHPKLLSPFCRHVCTRRKRTWEGCWESRARGVVIPLDCPLPFKKCVKGWEPPCKSGWTL